MEYYGDNQERTEEDKIIEILNIEGRRALYEDTDFLPSRYSLYERSGIVPAYDSLASSSIIWRRPHDIHPHPEYFSDTYGYPLLVQGSLPDENFIGALMGIAVASNGDLLENIIYSRPDDFKRYGVYTCRFYVEGQWIEVITDTRIPCIGNDDYRVNVPVYSRSVTNKEMWISLIEKAYAKALGSYEAISRVQINDALIHLTGGSVQELTLNEDTAGDAHGQANIWKKMKYMLSRKEIILARPMDKSAVVAEDGKSSFLDDTPEGFEGILSNRLYTVIACKEIGMNELVMLRCPWISASALNEGMESGKDPFKSDWDGDWSDGSSKWDEYIDVLHAIEDDPEIKWRRNKPNGFMWVSFRQFVKFFQSLHCCKLFPRDQYNAYVSRGEWKDKTVGGPMVSLREREEGMRAASKAHTKSLQTASACLVIDGDTSWFTNPQYKIKCNAPSTVYISLMPINNNNNIDINQDASTVSTLPQVAMTLVENANFITERQESIGDSYLCNIVGSEKIDGVLRSKGQEVNMWNVHLQPNVDYFLIPNTTKKGIKHSFLLRVFSQSVIHVEPVLPRVAQVLNGEWTKTSTTDSTGGPLTLPVEGSKKPQDNSKWCQNPQYFLRIVDKFGTSDLNIKIVVRRTDKVVPHKAPTGIAGERPEPHVGFTICKPNVDDDVKNQAKGKRSVGQPRVDPFGQVIYAKPSSLKKPTAAEKLQQKIQQSKLGEGSVDKLPDRKISLDPLYFHASTTFCSRHEACMYLPKAPRSWMPDGLIIIPYLSERGARGTFDIEIYSSGNVVLEQLPGQLCHSLGGDWNENCAGGSHLCTTFKKNPHFYLDLFPPKPRPTTNGSPSRQAIQPTVEEQSCNVRIALARCGASWRSLCRTDAVGCMIGFYVYIVTREGGTTDNHKLIHETVFAPTEEVSTEVGFTLDYLPHGQSYMIVPTTFTEGKHGSFVLSIAANCEYHFVRET